MSYSLKNKTIALIALALAAVMVIPCTGQAQTAPAAEAPTPISEDMDIFGLDEEKTDTPAVQNAETEANTATDTKSEVQAEGGNATAQADSTVAPSEDIDDFLNDVDENNDLPALENTANEKSEAIDGQPQPAAGGLLFCRKARRLSLKGLSRGLTAGSPASRALRTARAFSRSAGSTSTRGTAAILRSALTAAGMSRAGWRRAAPFPGRCR